MPRPLSSTETELSKWIDDVDAIAVTGERLVDRVVDDLVDHVVQTRAVIGVADVHAGPLANGFETLEDLDALFVVVAAGRGRPSAFSFADGPRPADQTDVASYFAGRTRKDQQSTEANTSLKVSRYLASIWRSEGNSHG